MAGEILDEFCLALCEQLYDHCNRQLYVAHGAGNDQRLAGFTIIEEEKKPSLNVAKLMEIEHAFSKPCREAIDYIPTQYIAEYVKTLGYDGIVFRSSYVPGGTNITLFNPEVAKAIASAPYKMDSIIYRARRIFPLKHLEAFDIIATNQKSDSNDP